jgi:hypothetical protein
VSEESDIGARHRPDYGFSTWLGRAARKVENSIARTRYNLSYSFDLSQSD